VNDPRQTHGESGLWFSPQPFPPALVGQRHMDSTLFDLRQLDAGRLQRRDPDVMLAAREQAGSGLIDIKTLVGVQQGDAAARPLVIPPPRGLVNFVPIPAAPVAPDRGMRKLLAATCIALLMVVVALAVEALA
jgi:hypothetical protein